MIELTLLSLGFLSHVWTRLGWLGLAWACLGLLGLAFHCLALDSSPKSTGPIAWMWLGLLGPCLALPVLAMVVLGSFSFLFSFPRSAFRSSAARSNTPKSTLEEQAPKGYVVPGSTSFACVTMH